MVEEGVEDVDCRGDARSDGASTSRDGKFESSRKDLSCVGCAHCVDVGRSKRYTPVSVP